MRKARLLLPWVAVLFIAAAMVGCGSTPSSYLQSVAISPSAASGSVQFVATGTRINGSKVSPVSALWWNSQPWTTNPTTAPAFTVDENGNAVCMSNPVIGGTFPVWATAPVNPNTAASQMGSMTPQVVGTATITCP